MWPRRGPGEGGSAQLEVQLQDEGQRGLQPLAVLAQRLHRNSMIAHMRLQRLLHQIQQPALLFTTSCSDMSHNKTENSGKSLIVCENMVFVPNTGPVSCLPLDVVAKPNSHYRGGEACFST